MLALRLVLICSFLVSSTAFASTDASSNSVAGVNQAASPDQMQGIWYSVKVAQDDEQRVRIIAAVARQYHFSPIQAEALIQVVFDSEARAELIHLYADRLTNQNGVTRLLNLVPEGRVRKQLTNRLVARSLMTL